MLHAVLEHPAIAGGVGDDVIHQVERDAGAGGERHRLRPRRDMHAGQQLVDDLHRGAEAGALADLIDLAGDRIEHRAQPVEGGAGAGGHHRHLAGGGLGGAAGDRGIQHQQAARLQLARDLLRIGHRDGGGDHDPRARAQPAGQPVLAEQHGAALRGIDQQQQHGVEPVGELRRAGGDAGGAGLAQRLARRRVQVGAIGLKPRGDAGAGRPHAHGAKADNTDAIAVAHGRSSCADRGLCVKFWSAAALAALLRPESPAGKPG